MERPTSPSLHEPLIFGASLAQTPPAGPWRVPASVSFHTTAPLQLPQSPALCGHSVPAYWLNRQDGKIRIVTPCFRICLSAADSRTSKLWHLSWLDPQTQPSELGLVDLDNFILSLCRNSRQGHSHPRSHRVCLPCPGVVCLECCLFFSLYRQLPKLSVLIHGMIEKHLWSLRLLL